MLILTYISTFFLTLATSLPLSPEPCDIIPGKPQGVYMCTEPNWSGTCVWKPMNTCINTVSEVPRPRSIGPDPGVWCEAYWKENCTGSTIWWDNFGKPTIKGVDGSILP